MNSGDFMHAISPGQDQDVTVTWDTPLLVLLSRKRRRYSARPVTAEPSTLLRTPQKWRMLSSLAMLDALGRLEVSIFFDPHRFFASPLKIECVPLDSPHSRDRLRFP